MEQKLISCDVDKDQQGYLSQEAKHLLEQYEQIKNNRYNTKTYINKVNQQNSQKKLNTPKDQSPVIETKTHESSSHKEVKDQFNNKQESQVKNTYISPIVQNMFNNKQESQVKSTYISPIVQNIINNVKEKQNAAQQNLYNSKNIRISQNIDQSPEIKEITLQKNLVKQIIQKQIDLTQQSPKFSPEQTIHVQKESHSQDESIKEIQSFNQKAEMQIIQNNNSIERFSFNQIIQNQVQSNQFSKNSEDLQPNNVQQLIQFSQRDITQSQELDKKIIIQTQEDQPNLLEDQVQLSKSQQMNIDKEETNEENHEKQYSQSYQVFDSDLIKSQIETQIMQSVQKQIDEFKQQFINSLGISNQKEEHANMVLYENLVQIQDYIDQQIQNAVQAIQNEFIKTQQKESSTLKKETSSRKTLQYSSDINLEKKRQSTPNPQRQKQEQFKVIDLDQQKNIITKHIQDQQPELSQSVQNKLNDIAKEINLQIEDPDDSKIQSFIQTSFEDLVLKKNKILELNNLLDREIDQISYELNQIKQQQQTSPEVKRVSSNSKEKNKIAVTSSFTQRQQDWKEKQQRNKQSMQEKLYQQEQKNLTFMPKINKPRKQGQEAFIQSPQSEEQQLMQIFYQRQTQQSQQNEINDLIHNLNNGNGSQDKQKKEDLDFIQFNKIEENDLKNILKSINNKSKFNQIDKEITSQIQQELKLK